MTALQSNKPRFTIDRLEERIAPSAFAGLGAKAHHNTVVVTGTGGSAVAELGGKAHHNVVVVTATGDCGCCVSK